MKKSIILIMELILLFSQAKTFATPSLGVGTDTGIYSYLGSAPPTDKYIKYFASILEKGTVEGFVIGPSLSYLTIFTSYNPSTTPIWLLANTGSNNLPMTFGGANLSSMGSIGKSDGYNQNNPYYGVQLPTSGWLTVNDTNYFEKTYYFYKAQIKYSDGYDEEDYFFAAADTDGTSGISWSGENNDAFSPKTTSACDEAGKVPEPATTALLGFTLLGYSFFKIKIKKRVIK